MEYICTLCSANRSVQAFQSTEQDGTEKRYPHNVGNENDINIHSSNMTVAGILMWELDNATR